MPRRINIQALRAVARARRASRAPAIFPAWPGYAQSEVENEESGEEEETNMGRMNDDDVGSIGFEDIVGDSQEIVGDVAIGELLDHAADEMISGDPQTALAELAVARKAVPNAVAVFQRKLRNRRRQPLGFAAVTIPIATTDVSAVATPQQLFRAKRMVIPSNVATNCSVADVKVGNKSQLVGTEDPITGAMFSELAVGTFVDFLTANVGNKVGVVLRNVNSTVTVTTIVTMIGVVAEP
jgi:hypothetical protein